MPMTVVVTRNSAARVRGFLASCMCEIAPGVYTAPRMSSAVRDRVWNVMNDFFTGKEDEAVVMTWPAAGLPGGQGIQTLGVPRTEVRELDGVFLTSRPLSPAQLEKLKAL